MPIAYEYGTSVVGGQELQATSLISRLSERYDDLYLSVKPLSRQWQPGQLPERLQEPQCP